MMKARKAHVRAGTTPVDQFGCRTIKCTCGWESTPTNAPQHLPRAFRSHREHEVLLEQRAEKQAYARALRLRGAA